MAAGAVIALGPLAPAGAQGGGDPQVRLRSAERRLRLACEEGAARIQRAAAAGTNLVMTARPASTFRLRNARREALNRIDRAARRARADFAALLDQEIDRLIAQGVPIGDVSRLFDQFDEEVDQRLRDLDLQGSRDVSNLIIGGNRTSTSRGLLAGTYDLFVSEPLAGRGPVRLGRVTLGANHLVRGPISTQAAAEFFLTRLDGQTPRLDGLPRTTALRGVRWMYRSAAFSISNDDGRAVEFVPLNADEFDVTGIDLLPERLRIDLERRLENSLDVRANPDGADGFFRSVTYTFRRVAPADPAEVTNTTPPTP